MLKSPIASLHFSKLDICKSFRLLTRDVVDKPLPGIGVLTVDECCVDRV